MELTMVAGGASSCDAVLNMSPSMPIWREERSPAVEYSDRRTSHRVFTAQCLSNRMRVGRRILYARSGT